LSIAREAELPHLATVFGEAFVTEPMLRWPLGDGDDLAARLTLAFTYVLEDLIPLGMVFVAGDSRAAAIWVPPNGEERAAEAWSQARLLALADDGGERYRAFWDWVYDRYPDERLWDLDSIAVDPGHRGEGLGSALIAAGLERARTAGTGAFLATGTPVNLPLYRRAGFRVVEDAEAPDGGPHIWFMRCDP
jgi:GNAT superfamily N-acetyltransferase